MTLLRRLRKRILTPPSSATSIAKRGFYAKTSESVALLETVGHSFLTGYGYAVGSADLEQASSRLETVHRRFRGFAFEGAAMGYAVLDGLGIAGRNNTASFLTGPGQAHIYMAYVGVGWACARLPRWRWRRVLPADQLLCWLVLDGYGFHQAYFRTRQYVHERHQDPATGWPYRGAENYASRAIDQGIGRALWFVEGTDPQRLAARIGTFAQPRQSDLWSGAGLAATYAGGADQAELHNMWKLAGRYRPNVAQGSAFAAEARVRAALVTEHTELATQVFCELSPQAAASMSRQVQAGLPAGESASGAQPRYETWREQLAKRFASRGRC